MNKENHAYVDDEVLFSKKVNSVTCGIEDGTGEYYVKQGKVVMERQALHLPTHVEACKLVLEKQRRQVATGGCNRGQRKGEAE